MTLLRSPWRAVVLSGLVGCGATPAVAPQSPTAERAAGPAAATAASTPAPDASPAALTTPQPTQSETAGSRREPLQTASNPGVASSSTETETFPSGLVVDPKTLGGPAPGPELPKGTRILHIGDSFAGALGIELNKVLTGAGVKSRLEFEKSTYIPTWAHNGKLSQLLTSFKPDLVLISLGANELENPEPEKRAGLIQKIVRTVGNTPCVWIAPVLWEGAKGALMDVIRANVGSCVYLDSNRVIKHMPRAGDKIHPSMAARPDWAAATARWLAYHRKATDQQAWAVVGTP